MAKQVEQRTVSAKEAADILGVHLRTVLGAARSGRIAAVRVLSRWRVVLKLSPVTREWVPVERKRRAA
jgi:excisionase family DNA binding protein